MDDEYESGDDFPVIVVLCEHCGEQIMMTRPHMDPDQNVPAERIHQVYKPYPPYFSVGCQCGHFTVFGPET